MINNYLGLSECVCAHEFMIGAMSAKNTVCSGKVSHRTLSTFEDIQFQITRKVRCDRQTLSNFQLATLDFLGIGS